MLVLGFHGGRRREDEDNRFGFSLHDSAAVLVDDEKILSAIEEERLSRIKHTNCFPARAIKFCLDEQRLQLKDVDLIVTNHSEGTIDLITKSDFLDNPRQTIPPSGKKFMTALFAREFGVDVSDKLRFYGHHLSHAWSAYGPSGFESSLILVLDGDGDDKSGMVLLAEGSKLTELRRFDLGQSLGHLYAEIIKLLGYNRFDEYKVMGLAPYGNPRTFTPLFERHYQLLPQGNYALDNPLAWLAHFDMLGLVERARRKGEPCTQVHMDLAAALQATLEKIVMHILSYYRKETKQTQLCLAGGVAHNCTMNGKILYSGLFEKVFVQPAAHDAGGALGAAWGAVQEEGRKNRPRKIEHLYWGTDISDDLSIERHLAAWQRFITFERVERVCEKAASLLAGGAVLGWAQGRSEFGPRALGSRSIVADPRPSGNKLLINQMIKKREEYRPFAPSVLEERIGEFFEVPPQQMEFPFMIFVLKVREEWRQKLGAITHVDGTARVHTVSRKTHPLYWELISEFEKLTGVPILLNTSFNNNVEPIVDSIQDSIVCFLTTGLHHLVIGNYIVSKKETEHPDAGLENLIPALPAYRRLVQRKRFNGNGQPEDVYEVQSSVSHFFSQPDVTVSTDTFSLLRAIDGRRNLSALLAQSGITETERVRDVYREIGELWSQRVISLEADAVNQEHHQY
jgi:carbamoyltransferase